MSKLKVGVSKAVITPPIGVKLAGYAHRIQRSVGILDDLYARALVLSNNERTIAIVICDLLWLSRSIVKDIKRRIRKDTGIPEESVLIACTHTHYGPDLTQACESYIEYLKAQIVGVVYSATRNMKPASIGFAKDICYAGANRRNPKSPYGPYYLYSWPEGPIDPEVVVALIKDDNGNNICSLVNYACHPVTLGPNELGISKDYPKYVIDLLESTLGGMSIFINGCCGNINPRWIWDKPEMENPPRRKFPEELEERLKESKRIGIMIGASALKALETITNFQSNIEISSANATIELPVRKDLPERILSWMKPHPLRDHINEILNGKKSITTEVQALRIGDSIIVGLPGEIFVEYQLELKRKAGFKTMFISELANDNIYYVPTTKAYEEGGYEPTVAIVAPEAGSILIMKALELIQELKGK